MVRRQLRQQKNNEATHGNGDLVIQSDYPDGLRGDRKGRCPLPLMARVASRIDLRVSHQNDLQRVLECRG